MSAESSIDETERRQSWRARFSTTGTLCLVATLFRVVLLGDVAIRALADASADDELYVFLGRNIASGFWLGDYSYMTLAKGPGYPIFIGLTSYLHIPLLVAQEALYIAACAAFALALLPALEGKRRCWAAALYIVLLFNPTRWEGTHLLGAVRQQIYNPLTMIGIAAVAGCVFWSQRRARLLWMLTGGTSLSLAWLTREESVCFVPAIILLASSPLLLRDRVSSLRDLSRHLAGILAIALVFVGIVLALNRVAYGVYTIVEIRDRAFNDAIGALNRVNPRQRLPKIGVSRRTREMIYAVSPAFRELRPYLEGRMGQAAEQWSEGSERESGVENEMIACWFNYAVRGAAGQAGRCETARDASAYYRRLANEINDACDRGEIPCGPRRSGLIPPLDAAAFKRTAHEIRGVLLTFLTLPGVYDRMPGSVGSEVNLKMFAEVTRSRLAPAEEVVTRRSRLRGVIAGGYRATALLLVIASPVLAATALRRQRTAKRVEPVSLIALVAGSAVVAYVALLAFMSATACPGNAIGYVSTPYSFYLVTLWAIAHEGVAKPSEAPRAA